MNLVSTTSPEIITTDRPMQTASLWVQWLIALCLVWLCYSLLQNALCYLELLNAMDQITDGKFT